MQTANKLPRWLNIGLAFPIIILNGWLFLQVVQYFQPLVSIIVAAILLAFVLDYPIQFLQQQGVKRNLAIGGVLLLTVVIIVGLGITLVPLIIQQLNELANILPSWIDSGTQQLQAFQDWALSQQHLPINLSALVSEILERLSNQLQSFTGRILSFAVDTIGIVVNVLLAVVLTIYLILNGERLWDGIFQWFSPNIGSKVRQLLREDFHNYFIGQATLGAVLGVTITLAFWILQVPLALLFGIGIGLFSLFPFGTGIGIGIVSLLVALQNFWLGVEVLGVAVAIDQVNSNFIAPRILGNLTGLNPVWVVISLLLGAKLGSVLGLLIAIPVASFIKDTADSWRAGEFNRIDDIELESAKSTNTTNETVINSF
ncbi:membrane protein [Nostoc linckia z18]|jgi:predicted PurR-regulated permease PerM|uniref:Membrane protein n=2 Tax=Nostoc linckia TaxID=92942 RepID=A0A9Q5Z4V8_NOSLI|nr:MULTISPECIES: AI-2E family transporter [Nostoc]PHK27110.1 membrane protein [Nostoc linckia z15]PHK36614.1 membrane protein [Nostoc linckia z16]MBC1241564.1 AI-2E family transporter [Nostoc sp. 2RC]PHJ61218.1 membrane protein [Nostoc linckia z3]PHJ65303.1 membrane protein [Nostoc linckia z1]